jgi:adenylate kinase
MANLPNLNNRLSFIHLIGRPGAGKDTQIQNYLATNPDVAAIPIGDIFRRGQNPQDTEFGSYYSLVSPYKEALDQGQYIPGEAIAAVVKQATEKLIAEGKRAFIINGHPKGLTQLQNLDELRQEFESAGFNTRNLYIYLGITKQEGQVRRSAGEAGGEGYFPRPDDQAEALKKRLDVFEEEARPMLKELLEMSHDPKTGTEFKIIRGNKSEGQVQADLANAINPFLGRV